MKKITVYTMEKCPFCEAAKRLLKERQVEFSEIRLGDSDAEWDSLFRKSGMRTVPQIFMGDELIGGFDALSNRDKEDKLESLR